MTEEEIKQATCQVIGGGESGTGWLVTAERVLTAYHCVQSAAQAGQAITVRFGTGSAAVEHAVVIGPYDADLDVCLLQLPARLQIEPIPLDTDGVRPGAKWFAFGHATAKVLLGHVVRGEVQQVLTEPVHGVDLDLSVEPGTHVSDYRGLSGSALIVDDVCKGMLRVNIDSAIGAMSITMLKPFLEANGLLAEAPVAGADARPIGARPAFDELFEAAILKKRGGYLFVEGSHGIGKSTYCREFRPSSRDLDRLGVYSFTEAGRGTTPAYQAQPEVFFDWANSLLSARATGKPARLLELSYSQLIEKSSAVLQDLARRCAKAGQVGVLFIDGINEAAAAGPEALKRFINLLPQTVPDGLVVVVTGVGLDAIAGELGMLLQGAERLTLPSLDGDIQLSVCASLLDDDKRNARIVATLCDRAMGHPLYLRYLTDLVNGGATEGDITELPVFSGAIQDYYETIWAKLVPNSDGVNLLGILTRLRWGIPPSRLTGMLTSAEAGVLPSTLTRIRHLLAGPETTAIYHPSFSEYVVHKTSTIDEPVHARLARYCGTKESQDYGVLNKVYHGLRGGPQQELQAIQNCHQEWVDGSVLLDVEPDVLLTDVEDTLTAATKVGTATDVVRLLLLSQRLTFRYNLLFVQSAELVAKALISLGKEEAAFRHVVRNDRLIVSVEEAFAIANAFTREGCNEKALEILELVQRELNAVFEEIRAEEGLSTHDFLHAARLRLHAYSLALAAGERPPFNRFLRFVIEGVLRRQGSPLSKEEADQAVWHLTGEMMGAELCLDNNYRPLPELGFPADEELRPQLLIALQALGIAQTHAVQYGIPLKSEVVDLCLADVERAIGAVLQPQDKRFGYIDILIEAGAPSNVVAQYAAGIGLGDGRLPFYEKNRAEPDQEEFESAMSQRRAAFFLEEGHALPSVQMPTAEDWERSLESIARAVAWADARARRAFAVKNQTELDATWAYIAGNILPCLAFNLESRISWDSSYSIPEKVVPPLYRHLAKLVLDCFPTKTMTLLDALECTFAVQLGLYNEGFRECLREVLPLFIERNLEGLEADKVFSLVLSWRDYVASNVENRHELVPELLQIVPLLARLGATEEALNTYKSVLAVSMGPSWYKEDQLSLMSGTLEALPATSPVPASSLAQMAGLLERAAGEMTFQRFVRADKGNFIGQLCRRGLFSDAVRYFQHQACGTREELFAQATTGDLDRVSTLVGMRFPGAALEEQAALLTLLRCMGIQVDWQVRWALLEVYQHGDERHLSDWGREYAAILAELAEHPEEFGRAKARVFSITTALNDERAWLMLQALVAALPAAIRPDFVKLLDAAKSSLDDRQIAQLKNGFGLRDEPDEVRTPAAIDTATNVPTPDAAEADAEDDRFLLPGTFGKRSAIAEARTQIEVANTQLKRRNFSEAARAAVAALKTLQSGGWSIWSNNHSASEADSILSAQVSSPDDLARMYGPLILEERHTQRWAIASHLVSLIAAKTDTAEQAALVEVAIDHVRKIVGDASAAAFAYVGTSESKTPNAASLELLFWTLDHPAWERRDSAASMLLWAARTNQEMMKTLVPLALSMDDRNRGDVASAVLDILSREEPSALWERIEPYVDITAVLEQCQHVGRYTTFMRIAERASKCGAATAATAVTLLQERFPEDIPSPTNAHDSGSADFVPPTLNVLWRDLFKLGVLTDDALRAFETQLAVACSPLTVESAHELESLVAEGGREDPHLPTGRWASIIRNALSKALFYPMPVSLLRKVEAVLRPYNPSSLNEPPNGRALLASLVTCLRAGLQHKYVPSHKNLIFLDLQCHLEAGDRTVPVEVTAHLVPRGTPASPKHAPYTFKATELPQPGADEPLRVCGRAKPTISHFGSLSPSVATPRFLQSVGAQSSDTVRHHWRDGSTVRSVAASRRHEIALLAIQRDALVLPAGWQLQWTLRINGDAAAVLSKF